MPVETPSLFTKIIQDHLELKRKNAELNRTMPIDRYKLDDTFSNHPLFKSEEQARLEETMDGVDASTGGPTVLQWPGEDSMELSPIAGGSKQAPAPSPDEDSSLWGRSRDFDWGD
jgi:hypothetical protein